MNIRWNRPCYKCRSHYCDLSCPEPAHLQQRKPLTESQIAKAYLVGTGYRLTSEAHCRQHLSRAENIAFARAIEASHGIEAAEGATHA